MPPASNVTPLPTNATGACLRASASFDTARSFRRRHFAPLSLFRQKKKEKKETKPTVMNDHESRWFSASLRNCACRPVNGERSIQSTQTCQMTTTLILSQPILVLETIIEHRSKSHQRRQPTHTHTQTLIHEQKLLIFHHELGLSQPALGCFVTRFYSNSKHLQTEQRVSRLRQQRASV